MSVNAQQIPESWENLTFDHAIEPVSDEGKRVDRSDYLSEGSLPIIDQGEEFIGGYTNDISKRYNGPLPVIVFGDHTRRVKLVSFPFVVGAQGVKLLKPKDCWEPRFLAYLIPTLPLQNRGYGRHYQYLRQLRFLCPPKFHQREIVAEIEKQFTRLEAGVASLRRVQAKLKRYRAAVLKAACEGKLVPTEAELARREGRTYETGAQLLERILTERRQKWNGKGKYKEPARPETTNLPRLSDGWAWATLPQLGELNRGKSKHRPRDDARLYGGPYPFIQTGDIRKSGGTIREHIQTYSELGLQQSRLWPPETLCITIAANIAETGILTVAACFPDSVVGFVFDGDKVTTRYCEFFLRTAKENLERFAPATAQKNINLNVLQNVALALPPLPEQHRIVAEVERRLSVVEELEASVNANLQRATRLRQSILQHAFEGKLVQAKSDGDGIAQFEVTVNDSA